MRAGGPADFFARPDSEERAGRAARLGGAGGTRGRSGRLRLEPAGSGRGIPRTGDEAGRRRSTTIEQEGDRLSAAAARGCPPAAARAARRGLSGPRVRREHPRHGRRRGEDERQRLRRRARRACSSGSTSHARRAPERREPDELGFRYRRSNLGDRARWWRAPSFALSRGRARPSVKATMAEMRADAQRGAAVRHQDLRLDLQEPRGPARGGPQRRRTARRGRLPRARGRRRALLARSTPTSSRTSATPRRPTWSR